MRKDKWKQKYEGKRVVMWDDTNINFAFKPSGAYEQRVTYSKYYATNCGKGGVFIQLGAWMGVEELWVGAISDSMYQDKTEIFPTQMHFAENIDNNYGKLIPFLNIVDKGYRINLPAQRARRQTVIQPVFAKSDTMFSGKDTILSGSVASDCSGNERAVKYAKMSKLLRNGLQQNGCTVMIADVWLAWLFQVNFMYKPVH